MNKNELAALVKLLDAFALEYFGPEDDYDGSSEWSDFIQSTELVKRAAERAGVKIAAGRI